jgi:hypothetical protein
MIVINVFHFSMIQNNHALASQVRSSPKQLEGCESGQACHNRLTSVAVKCYS